MHDRSPWYDRQGNPIDAEQAGRLLVDVEGRRVALTTVGPYVVSTMFLVLDHGWQGVPVLFETMVFQREAWAGVALGHDLDTTRYATEREAVAGHEAVVTIIRATLPDDVRVVDGADDAPHEPGNGP